MQRLKPSDEYLPDGEVRHIKVPMMLTDSAPASVVLTDSEKKAVEYYERWRADHFGGQPSKTPVSDGQSVIDKAYLESVKRLNDAWRGAS